MNICIAGWYFHKPLLDPVWKSGFPAFIVKNREGDDCGIPSKMSSRMSVTGGCGLDFGCYQQYLMEEWDGVSDVLFMQDDGEIHGRALDDIAAIANKEQIDQAFIFRDEYEEFVNAGHSGRAFWCRSTFLFVLKNLGGFDVDWENEGSTEGKRANFGVGMFAKRVAENSRAGWISIIPGLHMGRRGWIPTEAWAYKRLSGQHGLVTPEGLR